MAALYPGMPLMVPRRESLYVNAGDTHLAPEACNSDTAIRSEPQHPAERHARGFSRNPVHATQGTSEFAIRNIRDPPSTRLAVRARRATTRKEKFSSSHNLAHQLHNCVVKSLTFAAAARPRLPLCQLLVHCAGFSKIPLSRRYVLD
jgi:hypothetical protein